MKIAFKLLVFTVVLICCYQKTTFAVAPIEDKIDRVESVQEVISRVAIETGVNPEFMSRLAFCESSYRYNIKGDGGKAYGIMQFHRPTFNEFSKKYGLELDYYSTLDQAKLASLMVKDGYSFHWTCTSKIKGV